MLRPPDASGPEALTVHVNVDASSGRGSRAAEATTSIDRDLLARAVRITLLNEGVPSAEISVTLLDDDVIRALNHEYLDRDHVTDVLSFSLHDEGDPVLADVYIGYEQAIRQASELGVDANEELVRLAIHGTLHALGYDHPETDRARSPLFLKQESLVARVLAAGGDTRQDPP